MKTSLFALALSLLTPLALGAKDNVLTAAEKSAGWELLFDGSSFKGWRGYGAKAMPEAGWKIENGLLATVAKVKGSAIITEKKYNDFELTWEWKVESAGNNGVKYFVTEDRPKSPGHEYQMIDDERHPDGMRGPKYQTGAFYDVLVAKTAGVTKQPGEWNSSKIVVRGNHVEHWLNGRNVLAYEAGSKAVKEGVAGSKFKDEAGFGDKIAGHIMLTYHSDACVFRNIKIRELKNGT
jgi:hypothetical protein